ncbi:hypothetical protein AMAG_04613 [Allomyces macrogynus ATCC 38327]|uniref:Protein-serine/threonine kinase n=1 Tax=Allomyces macrogynus (strain ATCC 38327) TaxID=578462 RepID=A0A0L0S5M9_ALLM3|nr:hypothetical protein AMAG_04613 [Allomyces macrogynus ATCC 38327]|eukprot:KNE57760.1 hypothetical protein AMAG_04613 [Allomyces macrogynus ATCC 38327]
MIGVDTYARQEPTRVTLRQLVYFGRHMSEHKLLKSANYLRTELPVRLAHRLRDLQTSLPYIAVANPHLAAIYADYWSAFNAFRAIKPIETMAENRAFCDLLRNRLRPADVLFRISDMGGGVPRNVLPYLFSFAHRAPAARQQLAATKYFTGTVQEQVRRARPLEFSTRTPLPVGRLGLGCPLSKVYAEYWGGSLDVYAMDGYGTDAYLRVGRLGTATENVNVQAAIAVDAK